MRTTAGIESWAGWHDAWVTAADAHAVVGEEAAARGRTRTAGEAFVRAAVYLHFAKFLWLEDLAKYRATTERSAATLARGMPLLDPTFERLEIPYGRDRIVANLRRPHSDPGDGYLPRPPVVVLVPGLDSTKEEFPAWEAVFLARGLATASLDGPGQGEAGLVQGIEPEFERPVGALLDALAGRTDLDGGRVGIAGLGLGNLYAARAAAFEPRITAVGTIGGPYTLVPRGDRWLKKIMHSVGTDDPDQARATMARFTLEGVTSRIRQPYLVIHGKQDHGYPWQDAERKAREAPRGELVLYEEGGSVCYTVDNIAKPYLADWLREKLVA